MTRIGFFFIFLSFISATVLAADPTPALTQKECPGHDFSKELGPTFSQGASLMCHAFVASDLITVNQKIGPTNHVSALDVGSNMAVSDSKLVVEQLPPANTLSGQVLRKQFSEKMDLTQLYLFNRKTDMREGLPDLDVLAYNLRPNICTERDLPSENSDRLKPDSDFLFKRVRGSDGKWDPTFTNWRILNSCKGNNSMDNFIEFTKSYSRTIQMESDQTLRASCRHPLPLKPMIAHSIETDEHQASRLVLSVFSTGNVAAIGYDHGVLMGGTADRTFSDHTSTIVGSRWNSKTSTCEFKLRNSQGPSCKIYRKDWPCKKGQLWIPSSDLDQMTTMFFYIDPQK